jgi:hypothetical protein
MNISRSNSRNSDLSPGRSPLNQHLTAPQQQTQSKYFRNAGNANNAKMNDAEHAQHVATRMVPNSHHTNSYTPPNLERLMSNNSQQLDDESSPVTTTSNQTWLTLPTNEQVTNNELVVPINANNREPSQDLSTQNSEATSDVIAADERSIVFGIVFAFLVLVAVLGEYWETHGDHH